MKITVITHDGKVFKTETDNYDAKAIAAQMNDNSQLCVTIGHLILHRGIISQIIPEDVEITEAETKE